MGKRRAKRQGLSEEVRRSLTILGTAAIGVLLLLAFFGAAGEVGKTIDLVLAKVFGFGRIIVPLVFLLTAYEVLRSRRQFTSGIGFLGIVLFGLGWTGIANLLFAGAEPVSADLVRAGGYLGLFTSDTLASAFGPLVAALFGMISMLAGVVLLFNISLSQMFDLAPAWGARDEEDGGLRVGETIHESSPDEEEPEETDGSDGEVEDEERVAQKRAPAETVMTVSERRTIEIPMELLDDKRSDPKSGDMVRNQEVIIRTLEQFGIPVEMSDVRVGPTVTQYAFRPAQGVKLSRIVALQNDLALALAAHPIRIEAPIPGKALVGVEVPNQTVARVSLREILESPEFEKRKSSFTVPLGKDISGATPLLAVEKAPHMLVAGATGSGKSVCLNGIIISLLYQNGPDDLKFIMVDPKRVELGVYAGIPHLLVPPIVKADEAVNALKWAVREMERRLDYLAKFGARDIDVYNAKAAERMPRIVIVIDELADLMIQNKRDVEATVVRIAQMARAAGIHLVLATQRPSVDVITGTIKANIPTRLAFAVASQVDSKTIIDTAGADKLLGRGDMLMSTPELSKPRRVQGAFVSDAEIERVVNFLKKESVPDYNYQVTDGAGGHGGTVLSPEDSDTLLDEAIEIAIDAERVSTSYLQRRMKIGYSRAARIVDLMEKLGVVGPPDGSKPREVLVSSWPPDDEFPDIGAPDEDEEEIVDESEDTEEADETASEEDREETEETEFRSTRLS